MSVMQKKFKVSNVMKRRSSDLLGSSHQTFFTRKAMKVRRRKPETAMMPVSH